jgi:hypothetical protein
MPQEKRDRLGTWLPFTAVRLVPVPADRPRDVSSNRFLFLKGADIKRQGKEVENATRRVLKLEEELEAARHDRANLEHGLKLYAATCLVTAMQQATASVFAAGPAWTLLCAIRASSGDEVSESQSTLETQRILVILHALRGSQSFHRDLKAAMLAVCHKHEAAARQQGKVGTEFDGPIDYEAILDDLEWLVRKDGCYCYTRRE